MTPLISRMTFSLKRALPTIPLETLERYGNTVLENVVRVLSGHFQYKMRPSIPFLNVSTMHGYLLELRSRSNLIYPRRKFLDTWSFRTKVEQQTTQDLSGLFISSYHNWISFIPPAEWKRPMWIKCVSLNSYTSMPGAHAWFRRVWQLMPVP